MDPPFWLDKWNKNEIGFHQLEPHAALARYWPLLGLPTGSRVFVPLAGKSPDLGWLAAAGHQVIGIELSPRAVEQFYSENTGLVLDHIDLRCGNFFELTPALLGPIAAIFDRASLIALPAPMRTRYVALLAALQTPGVQTMLITLEYDSRKMSGPPHSVAADEVNRLYAGTHRIECIARNDQLADFPKFRERGLDQLAEVIYRLERR